jgi:ActD protein
MSKTTKALYTLCSDPEAAGRVVAWLAAAGVEEKDIVVISSEPFEELEFPRHVSQTHMPWIAALGGLVGGTTGFILAGLTQRAYPLPTGGMPLAPHWTNGIITYELTMLGAILLTLGTLLVTARLPNWRKRLYDPAISDGLILVGVVNPTEAKRIEIERALRQSSGPVKEYQA